MEPGRLPNDGQIPQEAVDCSNAVPEIRTGFQETKLLRKVDFSKGVKSEVLNPSANVEGLLTALGYLVDTPQEELNDILDIRLKVCQGGHGICIHTRAFEMCVVFL